MIMKMKRYELIGLNNVLSTEGFNTCDMDADAAMELIYLKGEVSEINEEAEKVRKDFIKTNTTKELEELNKKEKKTEEDSILYNKLNTELNNKFVTAYTKYIEEEVEVNITKISKNEFKKLRSSNKDNKKIDLNNYSFLSKYIVDKELKNEVVEEVKK